VQINVGSLLPQKDRSADPAAETLLLRPLPDPSFAALQALAAKPKVRNWVFDTGSGGTWVINDNLFDPNVLAWYAWQTSRYIDGP
jgi:hypothetical protein